MFYFHFYNTLFYLIVFQYLLNKVNLDYFFKLTLIQERGNKRMQDKI